jgi:hypothetical protein
MVKRNAPFSKTIRLRAGAADSVVFFALLTMVVAAAVLGGCSFTEVTEDTEEPPVPDPVVLVDQTGKEWDITTAVWKYGFEVGRFEFGLGPLAIRPLIEPEMLSPGDLGYPGDDEPSLVIGVSINGDVRAYGKLALHINEVADDYIGGAPLAVAY